MKRIEIIILLCCVTLMATAGNRWPKEIPTQKNGLIVIYEPTYETLEGNRLSGRTAVSYKKSKKDDPVFGVVWFDATLNTDKDNRMASLESLKITKSKFSIEATQTQLDTLARIIEAEVTKWELSVSLDHIITNLEDNKTLTDPNLSNDPPEIIYTDYVSTLVTLEGDPIVKKDDKMDMERVINTSFLIAKIETKFFLYAGGLWYESKTALSGYEYVKSIPKQLEPVHKQIIEYEKKQNNGKELERPTTPPEVIVRTTPAELIQTDGEPKYASIEGTSLLYATNTLDEIFKDVESQRTFTLLSGRWYSASNLKGPWTYIAADQLPKDFAEIPRGSEKDGVLVSVAGTPEAEEAKLDAQIPQTAKVDRTEAKIDVQFDGTPKFTPIVNTNLTLAENSNVTVLQAADGKYYAVENGIWFISSSPTGPYVVSDQRPADVDKIPPENAAYNTKYVYIYETTPEYVYVGYTPGYMGTYVYGPTIVYGTGYYYRPWYGAYYYPRPVTWGFGFSYNPWTGWSMGFGLSYNTGWYGYGGMHMSIHFGGYWGGGGYYRPPCRGWGYNGGYYGHHPSHRVNSPNIAVNRPVNINNDININTDRGRTNNVYNGINGATTRDIQRNNGSQSINDRNRENSTNRAGTKPTTGQGQTGDRARPQAPASNNRSNNVYAGKDGNVYQRDQKGNVNQRSNQQWQPTNNQSRNQVNQSQMQRDRATTRDQNFNHQRSTRSYSPPSGGSRMGGMGGGRRR